MTLRAELIGFLQNPSELIFSEDSFANKIKSMFQLYSIDFVISLVGGLICIIAVVIAKIDLENHSLVDLYEESNTTNILILTCFIAPIFEELGFRLFLKLSKLNICFGISLLVFLLSEIVIDLPIFTKCFGVVISTTILYLFFSYCTFIYDGFKTFVRTHYKAYLYFTAILFAFVHIFNFDLVDMWFVGPLLVLPQFTGGLVLGFVRLKYGIYFSILFHSFKNFVLAVLLPSIFGGLQEADNLNIYHVMSTELLAFVSGIIVAFSLCKGVYDFIFSEESL